MKPGSGNAFCVLALVLLLPSAFALFGCQDDSQPPEPKVAPQFLAGVAVEELDIPVGVPQSGYGARYAKIPLLSLVLGGGGIRLPDDRVSPYADGFFPTIGMLTRPNVKSLALELRTGPAIQRLVLCRAELAFVTDLLRRRVLDLVEQQTGQDLTHTLLLSATHTHAAGARFWRLPYFSDLGSDTFHPEVFERIAWSIARAVDASLAAVRPARIGAGIRRGFDPEDALYRDRRPENQDLDLMDNEVPWSVDETGNLLPDGKPDGKVKDDQLTLLRVDRADGSPLALIFHFPVHGTTFEADNLFMSSDTPGAIENQIELAFDSPVVAMHVQSTAGDIEPTQVFGHPQILLEEQARLAAPQILKLHQDTLTSSRLDGFLSFSRSFRQDYELLGYLDAPPPYSDFDAPCGAAQCGVVYATYPYYCLSRPTQHLPPFFFSAALGDLISHFLCQWFGACTDDWATQAIGDLNPGGPPYEQPPELFYSGQAAALLEGITRTVCSPDGQVVQQDPADLVLLGLPGEPTTAVGFQSKGVLARDLAEAGLRTGPEEVLVWGYTGDYFGYLLTPQDWLAGGYEISINLWGPLWGDYVPRSVWNLARDLAHGRQPDASSSPAYTPVVLETIQPLVSGPAAVIDEPADLQRFSTTSLRWKGGDPGVDRPRITLERRRTDGVFEAVRKSNGQPYDDTGPEIALYYEDDLQWRAFWEAPWDFPVDTYRLLVEGDLYRGGQSAPEPPFYPSQPYRLTSLPFVVSPAASIPARNPVWTPGRFKAILRYPPAEFDKDPNTPDGLRWRPSCPAQVSGTFRFYEGPPTGDPVHVEELVLSLDSSCRLDAQVDPSYLPGTHSLSVSFLDPFGNSFEGTAP